MIDDLELIRGALYHDCQWDKFDKTFGIKDVKGLALSWIVEVLRVFLQFALSIPFSFSIFFFVKDVT